MDTNTDTSETPKRRLEDHHPAETIAWDKPGAPAVPASGPGQSCIALRHVASMVVGSEGVSVFPTPAAAHLEPGHYMLSAPGARLAAAASAVTAASCVTDRAAEAAQPASTDERLVKPGAQASETDLARAWMMSHGYGNNTIVGALADLRQAVKDEVSDEWLLAFVTQYPFAARTAATSSQAERAPRENAARIAETMDHDQLEKLGRQFGK